MNITDWTMFKGEGEIVKKPLLNNTATLPDIMCSYYVLPSHPLPSHLEGMDEVIFNEGTALLQLLLLSSLLCDQCIESYHVLLQWGNAMLNLRVVLLFTWEEGYRLKQCMCEHVLCMYVVFVICESALRVCVCVCVRVCTICLHFVIGTVLRIHVKCTV